MPGPPPPVVRFKNAVVLKCQKIATKRTSRSLTKKIHIAGRVAVIHSLTVTPKFRESAVSYCKGWNIHSFN